MASTSCRIVGRDLRSEPGDRAVGADEELLEVPADVAGVPLGVGDVGELGVDRVPAGAVDLDLLEHRERHAVGRRAERLDLLGGARLLPAELVAREAEDAEPLRRRTSAAAAPSPVYCGVRPHFDATLTSSTGCPWYSASVDGSPFSVLISCSKIVIGTACPNRARSRHFPGAVTRLSGRRQRQPRRLPGVAAIGS